MIERREQVAGSRVAVLGLGRSGLAVGRAVRALGGEVVVYDRAPEGGLAKPELAEEARQDGLNLCLGWDEPIPPADLLVANPAVPMQSPVLARARADGIEVVSEVEFAYRISRAPIVAITGTNGKSTTTVMTVGCLRAAGELAVLCGNIFGSGYDEVPLTEAALNSGAEAVLVAEVSSFQLEWVSQFRPVSAAITNITPDHLDRYDGDFALYAATKQRIFAGQTSEEFAVVRASDAVVRAPKGPKVLTFGAVGEHAEVTDRSLNVLGRSLPWVEFPADEPHNRQNAAAAVLLAYGALRVRASREPGSSAADLLGKAHIEAVERLTQGRSVYAGPPKLPEPFGVLPEAILNGLREFKGLAHRMERIGERDRVRIINNSMCTNPAAVVSSAQAARDPVHLLVGGVNKGLDFRPLRAYLANGRSRAYLFGRDAPEIQSVLGPTAPIFATMQEAFAEAARRAAPGEVIMLAPGCASTDQFTDFRHRGDVFRAIAKEWLDG